METAIGAMLRVAAKNLVLLVDGFIMTACAVAAIHLYPDVHVHMNNEMNNFDTAHITKYF